jgi:hypothetical protein
LSNRRMTIEPCNNGVVLLPSPKDIRDQDVLFNGDCVFEVNPFVLLIIVLVLEIAGLLVIELVVETTELLVLTQLIEVTKANKNEIIRPVIFTIIPPVDRPEIVTTICLI